MGIINRFIFCKDGENQMKKPLFLILTILLPFLDFAGEFIDKGAISGWKFTPLQLDAGLIENRKLVDESTDTLFSFGLFILQQKSAVFSMAFIANTLQNNYGIQITPLFLGVVTDNNYGISFGWENNCKNCYGIQLGILNHSWAGEEIVPERKRVQVCGANIADTVYLGIFNMSNKIQIGLVNMSPGATFQLGLLNYNPRSYIPWFPIVNWDMGRKNVIPGK